MAFPVPSVSKEDFLEDVKSHPEVIENYLSIGGYSLCSSFRGSLGAHTQFACSPSRSSSLGKSILVRVAG